LLIAMPTPPKELQKMADELLGLARESNELRIKSALIEMVTELRVIAHHFKARCARKRAFSSKAFTLPAQVVMWLRSGKG
jgi:hypothetical protein